MMWKNHKYHVRHGESDAVCAMGIFIAAIIVGVASVLLYIGMVAVNYWIPGDFSITNVVPFTVFNMLVIFVVMTNFFVLLIACFWRK